MEGDGDGHNFMCATRGERDSSVRAYHTKVYLYQNVVAHFQVQYHSSEVGRHDQPSSLIMRTPHVLGSRTLPRSRNEAD